MTARKAAFSLLVEIGLTVQRWDVGGGEKEGFRKFVGMVSAGLVGTPHLISSTLTALGHILYNAKGRRGRRIYVETCLLNIRPNKIV